MSGFDGTSGDDRAIAGVELVGFTGSVPETVDNSDDVYNAGAGNDFVQAGDTDDTLLGGSGTDTLKGGGGDDRLDGGFGTDTLFGQDGNDIFFMTEGQFIDDVDGGAGTDTLDLVGVTGVGANINLSAGTYSLSDGFGGTRSITSVEAVLGTRNADTVFGGAANETVNGNGGDDLLNGGDGNDVLDGGSGNDTLKGAGGDDLLLGGSSSDTLEGGFGNDVLEGGFATDQVSGGDGNDRAIVREGEFPDDFDGGAGIDTLDLSAITSRGANVDLGGGDYQLDGAFGGTRSLANVENVLGTQLNDTIFGSGGSNTISGNGGNDRINGGLGRDSLDGGSGDDTFVMNDGAFIDSVDGGSGTNTLDLSDIDSRGAVIDLAGGTWDLSPSFGGPATIDDIDIVIGTQLNDRILSDFGTQTLNGGAGNDTFVMLEGKFIDDIDGGNGADRLDLSQVTSRGANINLATGTWDLSPSFGGPAEIASVETVIGTRAADTVVGSGVAETLSGGFGKDRLTGAGGNDVLTGGRGGDILNGGSGFDRFDFNSILESGTTSATRDVINGFTHLQDDLDFSTIDARSSIAGNQAFTFIGGAAFSGEGQIRAVQVAGDTVLEINTTGVNGAEMTVELSNFLANTLSAADFIL